MAAGVMDCWGWGDMRELPKVMIMTYFILCGGYTGIIQL